jgi:hypothetical protein
MTPAEFERLNGALRSVRSYKPMCQPNRQQSQLTKSGTELSQLPINWERYRFS